MMRTPGSPLAGRYAGILSKENLHMLLWLERSGMCTREEALAGSNQPFDLALSGLAHLEKIRLLKETAGLLRITADGSDLLTSLGLGTKSLQAYIPPNALPPQEQRWLEAMVIQYRAHYHAAYLHTLQCMKFWSWIRPAGPRQTRRRRKPVRHLVSLLLHDLLFHPLPPSFHPGYVTLNEDPSFIRMYESVRDTDPAPRHSVAEFLRLKDLFFRHERYSMMYLLEARHYGAPHFRLNMRNIYRYFLLETSPHRQAAPVPEAPPNGARRLPVLSTDAALDLRQIPQEYWPLQIPCASKHFFRDEAHDRISQIIHAPPFTIRIHDIITHEPMMLLPASLPEPCCSIEVQQSIKPAEAVEKNASFSCGTRQDIHGAETISELPADVYHCTFRAELRPEDLIRLSASWPQLTTLAGKAACWLHGSQPAVPLRPNELVNLLLTQVIHCSYIGDTAQCFLRRVCLDLMLAAATQSRMAGSKRYVRLSRSDKSALHDIFTKARQDVGLLSDTLELTEQYHISRHKFQNGFLQEFGISPKDYHQMLVMYHAFHLLHRNRKSMLITAIRCGFETPSELRSAIIRHFGHDPCHLTQMQ
ncbi:AraC family transcriptional regulator [Chitinophaga deserti]|uniref:AraC family transcriptional regulator n=1 Tax=Chitinophaga deserti TaxID=2164099 RepID=UPI000D6B87AE|nr:helix-turn-helix domain-containing protein [Chitinophaga deserti]